MKRVHFIFEPDLPRQLAGGERPHQPGVGKVAQQRGAGSGENGTTVADGAEPKALHFVRGHFKDYSVKGLFGKYKKVYWWDSQVRGEVMGGVVDKDYRVKRE